MDIITLAIALKKANGGSAFKMDMIAFPVAGNLIMQSARGNALDSGIGATDVQNLVSAYAITDEEITTLIGGIS